MRRIVTGAVAALCVAAGAALAAVSVSWEGAIGTGTELRIQEFFADAAADTNAGVHLWAGDAAAWDSCTTRIDLGEIRRDGRDGRVGLEKAGPLLDTPPWYVFFRRGETLLPDVHEIDYPGTPPPPQRVD